MLNSLLSLGEQALMNAQVGISTTGDNIANVDTDGYARRTITYSTNTSISIGSGLSIGTGASVEQIMRNYDYLLESNYLSANSESAYWESLAETLSNIETLFTESDDYSVATAMDTFFDSLTALEQAATDDATRQELLDYSETLIDSLSIIQASFEESLESVEEEIRGDIEEANALMEEIASLNKSITEYPDSLELQDERDQAIRELSNLIDVQVVRTDDTQVSVMTTSGQSLVDGSKAYSLSWETAQVVQDLTSGSNFDGELYFSGDGTEELLIEFTSAGPADGSASAATFKVSLDGGDTWLTDEGGNILEFAAGGYDDRVEVAGIEIYFGQESDPYTAATTDISEGDIFTVMPVSGLYWNSTTSGKVNITPVGGDGEDNRISGGELAGLLTARDSISSYIDELDSIASELIWQVNYQHSQGAGLDHYESTLSSNAVDDETVALADSSLAYADRLVSGGISFAFYDADTGESLGVEALDFSSITPGTSNFDPEVHSLQDVADAINASFSGQLTASIENGQLELTADDGVEFEFAGDSSGLMAALGLNTFFSGSGLEDMNVESRVSSNINRINAAAVDATGSVSEGDNTTAVALASLADKDVTLDTYYSTTSQTLSEHLHSLTAEIGTDTDTAARNYTQSSALADTLSTQQEEVAGVSLDEELTNLVRYQQAYEAASVLIQTTNELFDVVMALKS